jgi:anion-transporting  ArsA/GET3 family ATPase
VTTTPESSIRVILCTGAGGVGKTTTAAAIARRAAHLGLRAVVVTIDPARRLADVLGIPLHTNRAHGTAPVQVPLEAPGELWAMMLDAAAMFDDVVRDQSADPQQAERILSNSFYRSIAGSMGGTQEYMASEVLHRLHGDPRWDLVVVDTPPSRASLRFLGAPDVLSRFLEHRAFRAMMLAGGSGGRLLSAASQPLLKLIGSVVGGPALADAVAFFQSFGGMEAGFRVRSQEVREILIAESTAFVVVTTAQSDSVSEAVWFRDQLIERGHAPRAIVINRVHPRWAAVSDLGEAVDEAGEAAASIGALWRNHRWLEQMAASEAVQISRLSDEIDTRVAPDSAENAQISVIQVPLMAGEVESAEGLDVIGAIVLDQLMATGA